MWKQRFNDLWLWPFPEWFIRFSNRTAGVHLFDLMLVAAVLAVAAFFGGVWLSQDWLYWLGFALLAPFFACLAISIVTAQLHEHAERVRTSRCPICGKSNHGSKDLTRLEGMLFGPGHPFWSYGGVAIHARCLTDWPRLAEYVREFNRRSAEAEWSGGQRMHMNTDGSVEWVKAGENA